jgi:hypothetical protein
LLDRASVAVLPGSDFYLPATNLGVRVAPVDYDGTEVLKAWPGIEQMDDTKTKDLFPRLVDGCYNLEAFLSEYV